MNKKTKSTSAIPQVVLNHLKKVGNNIMLARKRRGFTQKHLANLVLADRNTIRRLEKGEPGVSLGIMATTLWVLQLESDLDALARPENDRLGQSLSEAATKKRVRMKKEDEYDF
ncbi:hypothetical protein SAMN02746065_1491 [Desulfocicer vacuolatum DSM 3385]|uniref:Helix-turn-helix domain-containing protein n=1 Tax=Desulfocicer vacuolatum DSM 3385 TaxID=1121400 RepID=A0A1W2EUH0_9BACT|nr:hypothetical protein [Desulfocicer vacuolatum]SMD13357.1 hypothetical protein SAMN02746065_1491 [Desulfocicer vacuolatum DSM 3385]